MDTEADNDRALFMRCAWRLVPFMVVLYIISFLDRVNIGFAALDMNADLGLTAEAFGFAGGIFFLGYFLFEMPSNLIMERVGARIWMCRIMVTWGIISMGTAFVRDAFDLYVLRFLLGVAEAGFFPGMLLYLTYWFPSAYRARFIAAFLAGVPMAVVIGAPVSGAILGMDGISGLHGWQWMFLIEGLPAVLLGISVLFVLPDKPSKAKFLTEREKAVIADHLAREPKPDHHSLKDMLTDARVWLIAIPDFGIVIALYGVGLWLPQIVKGMGFSNFETGFVVAVPYILAVVFMIAWGHRSDVKKERAFHVAAPAFVAGAALITAAMLPPGLISLAALAVATMGIYAALAVFWTLPPSFLGGTAAAGGIGLINALANLGGFAGPYAVGWLKDATGFYSAGMFGLGLCLFMTAALIPLLARTIKRPGAPLSHHDRP